MLYQPISWDTKCGRQLFPLSKMVESFPRIYKSRSLSIMRPYCYGPSPWITEITRCSSSRVRSTQTSIHESVSWTWSGIIATGIEESNGNHWFLAQATRFPPSPTWIHPSMFPNIYPLCMNNRGTSIHIETTFGFRHHAPSGVIQGPCKNSHRHSCQFICKGEQCVWYISSETTLFIEKEKWLKGAFWLLPSFIPFPPHPWSSRPRRAAVSARRVATSNKCGRVGGSTS